MPSINRPYSCGSSLWAVPTREESDTSHQNQTTHGTSRGRSSRMPDCPLYLLCVRQSPICAPQPKWMKRPRPPSTGTGLEQEMVRQRRENAGSHRDRTGRDSSRATDTTVAWWSSQLACLPAPHSFRRAGLGVTPGPTVDRGPRMEPSDSDHPLAREERTGISLRPSCRCTGRLAQEHWCPPR